jgi:predicted transposase YdaD
VFLNEQSEKQTASDEIILPHQRFDIVAKDPFYTFPEDMLQFLMGGNDFEFIEHVDTNLTTVEVRHMDILIKVLLDEQPVLIHCELQTDDSRHPNMVQRNVGYLGRCYEKYGLPIYSFVLYLRSTAGDRDPGGYFQDIPGHRFIVEYQVIRLNEIDGEEILQAQQPGLMPFTPLMKPPVGMSNLEWTTHCVEATQSLSLDAVAKSNLLVELWIMSGLRHERQDLLTLLSEDIVKESSVYEMIIERGMERGIEQGIEQGIEHGKQLGIEQGIEKGWHIGAKAGTIETILILLDKRFEMSTAPVLTPLLEPIDNLQLLRQLFHEALEVKHLEDFIRSVQTIQNGA